MKIQLEFAVLFTILLVSCSHPGSTSVVSRDLQEANVQNAIDEKSLQYDNLKADEDIAERGLFDDIFKKGDPSIGLFGNLFNGLAGLFKTMTNVVANAVNHFGIDPFTVITGDFLEALQTFSTFLVGDSSGKIKLDFSNSTNVLVDFILPLLFSFKHLTVSHDGNITVVIPTSFDAKGNVLTSVTVKVGDILTNSHLAAEFATKFIAVNASLDIQVGTCNKNCTSEQILHELLKLLNATLQYSLPPFDPKANTTAQIQYVINVFSEGGANLIKLIVNEINKKTVFGQGLLNIIEFLNLNLVKTQPAFSWQGFLNGFLNDGQDFLANFIGNFTAGDGIIDFTKLFANFPGGIGASLETLLKPFGGLASGGKNFNATAFLTTPSGGKTLAGIFNITNFDAFKGLDFNGFLNLLLQGGGGIGIDIPSILANSRAPDFEQLLQDLQLLLSGDVQVSITKLLKDSGVGAELNLPDSDLNKIFNISGIFQLLTKGSGLNIDLPKILANLKSQNPNYVKLLDDIKGILNGSVKVDLDTLFKDSGVPDIGGALGLPSGAKLIDLTSIVQLLSKGSGLNLPSIISKIKSENLGFNASDFLKIISGGGGASLGFDLPSIISKVNSSNVDIGKLLNSIQGIMSGDLQISLEDLLKQIGFPSIPGISLIPSFSKPLDASTILQLFTSGSALNIPDIISKIESTKPDFIQLWTDLKGLLSGDVKITLKDIFKDSGIPNLGGLINLPGSNLDSQLNLSGILQQVLKGSNLDLSLLKNLESNAPNFPKFLQDLNAILTGSIDVDSGDLLIDIGIPNADDLLKLPGSKIIRDFGSRIKDILAIFSKESGLDLPSIIAKWNSPNLGFNISDILKIISAGGIGGGIDLPNFLSKLNSSNVDFGKLFDSIKGVMSGDLQISLEDLLKQIGFPSIPGISLIPSFSKPLDASTILQLFTSGSALNIPDIISKIESTKPDFIQLWTDLKGLLSGDVKITLKDIFKDSGIPNLGGLINLPGSNLDSQLNLSGILQQVLKGSNLDLSLLKNLESNAPNFPKFLQDLNAILTGSIDVDSGDLLIDIGIPNADDLLKLPGSKIIRDFGSRIKDILAIFSKESGLDLPSIIAKWNSPNLGFNISDILKIISAGGIGGGIDLPNFLSKLNSSNVDFGKLFDSIKGVMSGDLQISLEDLLKQIGFPNIPGISLIPSFSKPLNASTLLELFTSGSALNIPDIISKIESTKPDFIQLWTDLKGLLSGDVKITLKDIFKDSGIPNLGGLINLPGSNLDSQLNLSGILQQVLKGSNLDLSLLKNLESNAPNFPKFLQDLNAILTGSIDVDSGDLLIDIGIPNADDLLKLPGSKIIRDFGSRIKDILAIFSKESGLDLPSIIAKWNSPNLGFNISDILKIISAGGIGGGIDLPSIIASLNSTAPNLNNLVNLIKNIFSGEVTVTIDDFLKVIGVPNLLKILNLPDSGSNEFDLSTIFNLVSGSKYNFTDLLSKLKSEIPNTGDFWKDIKGILTGDIDITFGELFKISGLSNLAQLIHLPGSDLDTKLNLSSIIQLFAKKSGLDVSFLNGMNSSAPNFEKLITDLKAIFNGTLDLDSGNLLSDLGIPNIELLLSLPGSNLIRNFNLTNILIGLTQKSGLSLPTILGKLDSSLVTGTTVDITNPSITTVSDTSVTPTISEVTGTQTISEISGSPTSSEVTGSPTSSEVTGSPISSEVTGSPTSSEVTGPSTNSEVTGSPTSSEVTGSPTSSEVTGSPTSSEVTGSPTRSEVTGSPTSSEVTGSPTSSEVTGSPTSSVVTGSPTSSEVTGPSTNSEVTGSPTSSEVTGSPTSSEVTGSPTSSEVTESPTSSEVTGSPTSTEVTGSPTSSEVTVSLTSSEVTVSPTSSEVTVSPTSSEVTGSPTSSEVTGSPSSEGTGTPIISEVTGSQGISEITGSETISTETSSSTISEITESPTNSEVTGSPTISEVTESTISEISGSPTTASVVTGSSNGTTLSSSSVTDDFCQVNCPCNL